MDFNAKLVAIEEPITGESKNGPWKKQNYIFETESQYPRKICTTVWGDKAISNPAIMEIGRRLNVSFELESREFNGRWYTDIRAWRIQDVNMGAPSGAQAGGSTTNNNSANAAPASVPDFPAQSAEADSNDDLPF